MSARPVKSAVAASRIRGELRARIDGNIILRTIETCHERLMSGWEEQVDPRTGERAWVPLTAIRVAALSKVLDSQFKLLNKLLPDLKAVEVTGEDGAPIAMGGQDKLVLATKLLALMRETGNNSTETAVSLDFLG